MKVFISYKSFVTDEDLRGQNVLHLSISVLLYTCSLENQLVPRSSLMSLLVVCIQTPFLISNRVIIDYRLVNNYLPSLTVSVSLYCRLTVLCWTFPSTCSGYCSVPAHSARSKQLHSNSHLRGSRSCTDRIQGSHLAGQRERSKQPHTLAIR